MLKAIDDLLLRCSRSVVHTWLILVLIGFAMAAVSYYAGVGVVTFDGRLLDGQMVGHYAKAKQIGYLAALNWSLFGAILLPTIVAFSAKMRGEMEPALRALARHSMARTPEFAVIAEDQLIQRWRRDRARGLVIPFLAAALSILFVVAGWWTSVGSPILQGITDPELLDINAGSLEYDWSIACILNTGHHIACGPNLAFGAVAFLLVPCAISGLAFWAMLDAALFVAFACGETGSTEAQDSAGAPLPTDWTLVAFAADPDDSRCGFEAFEGFFSALLFTAFFILLSLFLMITQNTYLRDAGSSNIVEFFSQDIAGAVNALTPVAGKSFDFQGVVGALMRSDKAINLFNPKTIFGLLTFFFVVFLCLAATMLLLRKAAVTSADVAEDHKAALAAELGVTEKDIHDRLNKMRFWPLGWMSQNTAIVIIIFMSFSLFSFRLAVLPIAVGLIWVVASFAAFLKQMILPGALGGGRPRGRRSRRAGEVVPPPPPAVTP